MASTEISLHSIQGEPQSELDLATTRSWRSVPSFHREKDLLWHCISLSFTLCPVQHLPFLLHACNFFSVARWLSEPENERRDGNQVTAKRRSLSKSDKFASSESLSCSVDQSLFPKHTEILCNVVNACFP